MAIRILHSWSEQVFEASGEAGTRDEVEYHIDDLVIDKVGEMLPFDYSLFVRLNMSRFIDICGGEPLYAASLNLLGVPQESKEWFVSEDDEEPSNG